MGNPMCPELEYSCCTKKDICTIHDSITLELEPKVQSFHKKNSYAFSRLLTLNDTVGKVKLPTDMDQKKANFCKEAQDDLKEIKFDELHHKLTMGFERSIASFKKIHMSFYCMLCDPKAHNEFNPKEKSVSFTASTCTKQLVDHREYVEALNMDLIDYLEKVQHYLDCAYYDKEYEFPFLFGRQTQRQKDAMDCYKNFDQEAADLTPGCKKLCQKFELTNFSKVFEGNHIFLIKAANYYESVAINALEKMAQRTVDDFSRMASITKEAGREIQGQGNIEKMKAKVAAAKVAAAALKEKKRKEAEAAAAKKILDDIKKAKEKREKEEADRLRREQEERDRIKREKEEKERKKNENKTSHHSSSHRGSNHSSNSSHNKKTTSNTSTANRHNTTSTNKTSANKTSANKTTNTTNSNTNNQNKTTTTTANTSIRRKLYSKKQKKNWFRRTFELLFGSSQDSEYKNRKLFPKPEPRQSKRRNTSLPRRRTRRRHSHYRSEYSQPRRHQYARRLKSHRLHRHHRKKSVFSLIKRKLKSIKKNRRRDRRRKRKWRSLSRELMLKHLPRHLLNKLRVLEENKPKATEPAKAAAKDPKKPEVKKTDEEKKKDKANEKAKEEASGKVKIPTPAVKPPPKDPAYLAIIKEKLELYDSLEFVFIKISNSILQEADMPQDVACFKKSFLNGSGIDVMKYANSVNLEISKADILAFLSGKKLGEAMEARIKQVLEAVRGDFLPSLKKDLEQLYSFSLTGKQTSIHEKPFEKPDEACGIDACFEEGCEGNKAETEGEKAAEAKKADGKGGDKPEDKGAAKPADKPAEKKAAKPEEKGKKVGRILARRLKRFKGIERMFDFAAKKQKSKILY